VRLAQAEAEAKMKSAMVSEMQRVNEAIMTRLEKLQ
jgi:hypothetical protein